MTDAEIERRINNAYLDGGCDAIDELTEAFDKWIKSTPQTAYYWTEFQVNFMRIAEQLKEKRK